MREIICGTTVYSKLGNKADTMSAALMASIYYDAGGYNDTLAFIESLPDGQKRALDICILRFEAMRKLGIRTPVLNEIDSLLGNMRADFRNEKYVHLLTIQASCLNDLARRNEARFAFRHLLAHVNEQSGSYLQIVCGAVHTAFPFDISPEQAQELTKYLVERTREGNLSKGTQYNIERALSILANI